MHYTCRPYSLRLGRPWRQRTDAPQRPPHTIRRGNHNSASDLDMPGQYTHDQGPQQQYRPTLTTDDTLTSVNGHESHGHTYYRRLKWGSSTKKIPRPRPIIPPSSLSTARPNDSRVQFIQELDQLSEKPEGLARVIRGFARRELSQRERLACSIGALPRHAALRAFGSWKGLVKNAFSPTQDEPVEMDEKRICFWIRSKSKPRMLDTMPNFFPGQWYLYMESTRKLIAVALRYVPEKLPQVLECVLRTQKKNRRRNYYFFVYEDVLDLLATKLLAMESGERERHAEYLAEMVLLALETLGTDVAQGGILISQSTIHRILDALPADAVEPWYRRLQTLRARLHPLTRLQFASRISRSSPANKLLSVGILHDLKEIGLLNINSPIAAGVCTSILTFAKKDMAMLDSQSVTPADLFGQLHAIGLVPNVITYTAIIRGLCLKRDLKTALDILEIMRQHGVQPDEFTYSVLIAGCTQSGDFKLLARLAIEVCNWDIRDPVVWNGVLHGTYICCLRQSKAIRQSRDRRGPRHTSVYILNMVYTRIFDATFLRPFMAGRVAELGGELSVPQQWVPEELQPLREIPALSPKEVIPPRSDTLAIMLLGLIRSLAMPYEVVTFYSHFREMLRRGHPVATQLVREQGTFVHDIVLRNLFKWRGSLRIALDIIGDMMKGVEKDTDSESSKAASMSTAEDCPHGEMAVAAGVEVPAANAEEGKEESHSSTSHTRTSESVGTGERPGSFIQGSTPVEETSSWSTKLPQSEAHAPTADGEVAPPSDPTRHPAPSVYTWSILVHGFMQYKLPREAERVLTIMREAGVQPSIVTYNSLVAGYAKMQNVPQAVKAMQRLEAEGLQADDATMRAFSYITKKRYAIKLMEEAVEQNKLEKRLAEEEAALQEVEAAGGQLKGKDQEDEDEDEDKTLDQDLEKLLAQLGRGVALPGRVSKNIYRHMKNLRKTAPLTEHPELKAWAKVRKFGLRALPAHEADGSGGLSNLEQGRNARSPAE